MTYESPRDPRRNNPTPRSASVGRNNMLPLLVAAAIAVALIAMMYPRTTTDRVGDTTNTGPSVQTETPSPTTEPRPTQAPQP